MKDTTYDILYKLFNGDKERISKFVDELADVVIDQLLTRCFSPYQQRISIILCEESVKINSSNINDRFEAKSEIKQSDTENKVRM